ncbi:MAG: putative toxin-antitoxin system toxin component, PIN family [Candidatus Firestonebacteria bacterium]|nr:putative toxin-antitoxin system toxin component, PIN family [Candidatus Firestonebacteria bacterium]
MMGQPRIVMDTNVFISAILFKGVANKLVYLWQNNKIFFLMSKEILEEYIRVLSYPKFALTDEEIKYLIEKEVIPFIQPIKIKTKINIVENDSTDNKFVSLALDGHAKYIISGDKHLLELKKYQQIEIVSIKKYLEIQDI